MTPAERKKLQRDRAKAGLVLVQAWVPVDVRDAVESAIAEAVSARKGEKP